MSKLGCEACKQVFSSFGAIRVIEADGDEYVFCCMSCVENHYFPDHKEKDQEIICLRMESELRGNNLIKANREIERLKDELQVYKDYHKCAGSVISELKSER